VLGTPQVIGSTSPVQVGSFAFAVVEGATYTGYAWITIDGGVDGGGTPEFRWTGPASPDLLAMGIMSQQVATADAYQNANLESATGYNSGFLPAPELAGSSTSYIFQLWIVITPSASGTLALLCANEAGGGSPEFTLGVSYLSLQQVLS
jgi:hypothetical protein